MNKNDSKGDYEDMLVSWWEYLSGEREDFIRLRDVVPPKSANFFDNTADFMQRASKKVTPWCLQHLGLSLGASWEDVQDSYRKMSKKAHPDLGGSDSAMAELNKAYNLAKKIYGVNK